MLLCTGVGVGIFLLVIGRVCGVQVKTVDEGFLIRYEVDNQEEITLPCQYTLGAGESDQTFRLEWLKNGELVYLLTRIAGTLQEPHYGGGYSAETVKGPDGSTSSDRSLDLVLLKPQRSDQGTWSCRADSLVGGDSALDESSIEHFVYYGPNFLAGTTDVISHEATFGEFVLTCHAEAYPPVQLTWKRVDPDKTLPDGTASYQGDQYGDPETEKTLTADFGNTTSKYKGEYECVAESLQQAGDYPDGGIASHIATLFMYAVPEPATGVKVTSVTDTKLSVTWTEGEDGGNHQYFTAEYKMNKSDEDWKDSQTVDHPPVTLTNLLPLTKYEIRVKSFNTLGHVYSESIVFTTDPSLSTSPIILIIGICIGIMFLIAIIVSILIFRKKTEKVSDNQEPESMYATPQQRSYEPVYAGLIKDDKV